MTSDAVHLVLTRLAEAGALVKPVPDGHMATCPAHPDRNPSLHIVDGARGAVLTCHAGCELSSVLDALHLAPVELFHDAPTSLNGLHATRDPPPLMTVLRHVADYLYTDTAGVPVCKVARYSIIDIVTGRAIGKTFRQFHCVGNEWRTGLGGTVPPLYRLPELVAAVTSGLPVMVVEGEKDADRLASLGYAVTTCAMGAGKWRAEYADHFAGAAVTVVADADEVGLRHAAAVRDSLAPVAASVRVVLPAGGTKDISDHLDAGMELGALVPVEASVAPVAPPAPGDHILSLLVLSAGLDDLPEPVYAVRGVLQLDSLAWLVGRPGHGKSFVALDLAGCVGTGEIWQGHPTLPGVVLYVVAEGLHGVKLRVRAWEAAMSREMSGVHFLPLPVGVTSGAWRDLCAAANRIGAQMVILDTQARMTVAMEENSAKDMGLYVHALEELRAATGATVLSVHHEGVGGERMRGSTALDGAATTILRAVKEEDIINLQMIKQKDAAPLDDLALRLVPFGNSAIIGSPDESQNESDMRAIANHNYQWLSLWWACHESDEVSVSELVRSGIVTEPTFHRVKYRLMGAGIIERTGDGRMRRYRLVRMPSQVTLS